MRTKPRLFLLDIANSSTATVANITGLMLNTENINTFTHHSQTAVRSYLDGPAETLLVHDVTHQHLALVAVQLLKVGRVDGLLNHLHL